MKNQKNYKSLIIKIVIFICLFVLLIASVCAEAATEVIIKIANNKYFLIVFIIGLFLSMPNLLTI